MGYAEFVHLRVHTAYSLSEGAVRNKELAKLCQSMRMPAVAMTDTNNLFGGMEFSGALADAGVQPIIGCQISLTREDDGENARGPRNASAATTDPIVVLVQNDTGYRNLLKLLSHAYLKSEDAHDPQVPLDVLAEHGEGLICLTGGAKGPVGRLLAEGRPEAAEALLLKLKTIYPGRLYVELQRHGLDVERRTEGAFLDLAYRHDLPIVATNEAFFPTREMFESHDALICIAEGAYLAAGGRRQLTPEHWLKPPGDMKALFADLPEAVDNTLVIAQRCAFKVDSIKPILPPFDCGEGRTEEDELRAMSEAGLEARLKAVVWTEEMDAARREKIARPYRERLDYELGVINEMGFPGYFLIVADFIQWSKDNDIPVGPGRGSGAGSVVAWALTITDLDPLRWGLLFERFLNPERVSMPDFDIDFCQDKRDQVIRYVQDKYGHDKVAQIITFGKLQARAVIRDVGRVLEMPYGQVDKISKLIPNNPANPVSLPEAIKAEPRLKELIDDDRDVRRLVAIAKPLEGLYRHASTHAAGVVIGDRPLDELIPLYRDPRSDMPVTGYNMKYVESAGLVKFDFLGLKTLTVIQQALDFIAEAPSYKDDPIDMATLTLEDASSYEMMGRGETTGVFQLESAGMRDVLRQLKPNRFEDIIAVVALYRPGPMDNIPSYIKRKHGQEEPDYLYPTLEPILKETFGIMIYQEQVMQIAQELSGYSLGGADLLRRAMGKKIQAEMDKQRKLFVEGAEAKGVPPKRADEIFDLVNKFAGYGFNKSHAAAYALVAYQTAYLKANFAAEFLAASMCLDHHNTDKLNVFRQELDRLGIPLLPPDINASGPLFTVERDKKGKVIGVRYGLAALKNVGEAAMEALVEERDANGPFKSIDDLADRINTKAVNKRQMENLVRAGALDSLNPNRRQVYEGLEKILAHAHAASEERNSNQIGLFGGDAAATPGIKLPPVDDWAVMERLKEEFDAIGFYLSAHPLDAYGKSLARVGAVPSAEVMGAARAGAVNLAGTVISKKERVSQKGTRYAFVSLSDQSGTYEITVFSEVLSSAGELLDVGQSVFIRATAQVNGEEVKFLGNSVEPLDKVAASVQSGMQLTIAGDGPIERIKRLLDEAGPGRGPVQIVVKPDPAREVTVVLKGGYKVNPQLMMEARAVSGIIGVEEL